jgi:DNA-binding Lrp family transcriptional regulator
MVSAFSLRLKPTELLVLLALADHAHKDGAGARPGISRLAWKTNLSESQVEKLMRSLRRQGVIKYVKRGGNGRASEYEIDFSAAEQKPPFNAEKKQTNDAEPRTNQPPLGAGDTNGNQPPLGAGDANQSATANGNNQPPLGAQSATAGDALTVLEPLLNPRPASSLPRSFSSETEKNILLEKLKRAREVEKAAAERVFNLWEKTLNFTGKERTFGKGSLQAITKKFREGFTEEDLNAAIRGYEIAAPLEDENTQKSGNFSTVMRDVEKFRQIYFANLAKGEK